MESEVSEAVDLLRHIYLDISWKNDTDRGFLNLACARGPVELVQLLLNHPDIDVNDQNDDGKSPFFRCCEENKVEVVKAMLKDSRVDINLTDKNDRTPLWMAAFNGHLKVLKWLMASGRELKVEAKGKMTIRRLTALEVAEARDKTEVAQLLQAYTDNKVQLVKDLRTELKIQGALLFER